MFRPNRPNAKRTLRPASRTVRGSAQRLALAAFAALLAVLTGAPANAELDDKLYVRADATTLHERPAADEQVVMHLERGRKLLEFERLGPGTHKILRDDFDYETFTITGGEWVYVGVFLSDAKSGWIRAGDVELNYRLEIREHVIDPCLQTAVQVQGLGLEFDEETAIKMAKSVLMEEIVTMLRAVEPAVSGQPRAERLSVYEESRDICVSGVLAGL